MNRKRVNGTGSIAQLKDGRYCVTFTDATGRRVYRYRQKRKDAELALAALLQGTDRAKDGPASTAAVLLSPASEGGPTLAAWAEDWLGECEGRLRHATLTTYRRQILRVTALLPATPLPALTPAALRGVFAELRRRNTGDRQLQQIYTVLRTCLEAAVRLDMLPANPMHHVDKPRWEPTRRDYWTVEETRAFLDTALASSRRYAPLLALLAAIGLRVSEALGLEWGDVNLARGTLTVRRALVWAYGEYRVDAPKTKAGTRCISLPAPALAALAAAQRATGSCPCLREQPGDGNTPSGPVFRGKAGEVPNNSNLRRVLLDICAAAGVPVVNIHGLRHVAATMALRATRDVHAVQRRLGHANVAVTMSIYAYALVDDAAVTSALDSLLGATATPVSVPRSQT